ncbi:hypothetical protein [Romboutsia sp.]|uniref:hypothetical protein n=1 Tax=Romboutsia sp. TaxID=1965302 RepID=UPI002B7A5A89|nr:hypothetical protein [Romboutsia sp.]HSQ88698.1 hypothetical protein [Romboutsia sp.]
MKNIINQLLAINYTDYNVKCDYKEKAYKILDKLTRAELLNIVELENMTWVNKSIDKENLKHEIYESLVEFRCDRQVLGSVAAHSYRKL